MKIDKKGIKIFLLAMLAVTLVFGLVLVGCATSGGGSGTPPTPDKQAEQLAADLNAIKAGSATAEGATVRPTGEVYLKTGLTVPAGVTLDLTADKVRFELQNGAELTVDGTVNTSGGGLRLGEGAVVINGSGTISLKSKGRLLNINGKKHLTLEGVTLTGLPDNDNSLVQLGGGGEFVMKSGAITGNTLTGSGGGVRVRENAIFTMEGGAITGNTTTTGSGGGVRVDENAIFTMKGGAITGNTATGAAGGVAVNGNAIFTMEGGEISGNTTTGSGGGVRVDENATFTMKDGEISGNTAAKFGGGVLVNKSGIFSKTGGTIYGDTDNIHTPGSTENTSNIGHAVFLGRGGRPDPNLLRNSTAGEGDNISWDGTNVEGFDGETTAG
ncbi:hypothetical protein FACS1894110_17990 [Spirochaetia bacterium]|nr:hypothetical protein FACS1894110_17990 [Spirochaetia bacterium]